jgi:hypothetical protein
MRSSSPCFRPDGGGRHGADSPDIGYGFDMPQRMTDLDRLLGATGIGNHHYISFDNPPIRRTEVELDPPTDGTMSDGVSDPIVVPPIAAIAPQIEHRQGFVNGDGSFPSEHARVKPGEVDASAASVPELPEILAYVGRNHTLPEKLEAVDVPQHTALGVQHAAVSAMTTLDRLRAGEMRP